MRTTLPSPGNAEKTFVVFVLLLSLGTFMNLSVTGPVETQNMGMVGMQILWSLLYLVTLALYIRSCSRPVRQLLTVLPVITIVVFAFASIFWSQAPALTARRSAALGMTLLFGVYFASRFSVKEQLRFLAWGFGVCILCSFMFELLGLNPSEGIPGWYGVFYHKTELGRNMTLSAIVFLFWKKVEPEHRGLARTGFLASVVLILLSRDMTSLVVLVIVMALLSYLQWALKGRSLRWAMAGIALLLTIGSFSVLWVTAHLEAITSFLGKDPMLTGRVPLWILSSVMALRQPWLGYGYNAFWLPDETYVQRIWSILKWEPPHAHNGFLELWLELGVVGVGLFLLVFSRYIIKTLAFLRSNSEPWAAWPATFLLFLFLANLTESCFLVSNSAYLILYVAVAATMYKSRNEIGVRTTTGTLETHCA